MNEYQLTQAANAYMAALPCPYAMQPAKVGAAPLAPAQIAALVAPHCPLAVSLFVQALVAIGDTHGACPVNAPFAVAHTWRTLYAGAYLGQFGYSGDSDNDSASWPVNGAARLECWLASDADNMARALACLRGIPVVSLVGVPASITAMLYHSTDYFSEDYEDGDLREAPAMPG
jgi:hypothetical protein